MADDAQATPPAGERLELLPPGRQLAVTWSIPEAFGGMTSALLHRSRAFVRLAGRPVDVLTFDARPDLTAVRARLERDGQLIEGVRLRNLYDELRAHAPAPGPIRHEPARTAPAAPRAAALDVAPLLVRSEAGDAVRLEHRRADGSLAVLDERGRPGGPRRLLTAFDADERPVRQWTSVRGCYADWIAEVIGDEPAYAIVDSKTTADFMARVRLPDLTTMHVVHASHLAGRERPLGMLRPSRREVFAHLERFDAVVFLTERQRADAAVLCSDPGNLEVVPNACSVPAVPSTARRDPAELAVVAGLTTRKRVDHAIEAVRIARESGVAARLTIHGDGPESSRLRNLVHDAGLDRSVRFAGHDPQAADAFAAASAMLLTSTSEGAPLVLLEAMARGCLPVAYDIPYGPGDLIVDGVNGFLVADGDVHAAADAVRRIAALPEHERERMRAAARATAARFDDAAITATWGDAQRAARERHVRPRSALGCELVRIRLRRPGASLRIAATLTGVTDAARAAVTLEHRTSGALLRRAGQVRQGRLALRLSPTETAFLGGGRLRVRLDVVDGDARASIPVGTVHPDTRRLARRAVQSLQRRLAGPRAGS